MKYYLIVDIIFIKKLSKIFIKIYNVGQDAFVFVCLSHPKKKALKKNS